MTCWDWDASVTLGDVLYVHSASSRQPARSRRGARGGRKDDKESIEALAQIKADTSTTRRDVTVICSKLDKLADRSDDHGAAHRDAGDAGRDAMEAPRRAEGGSEEHEDSEETE